MDLALRSLFAFLFVFAITRVVGRRELASLEPFDMIMLVVIGDLVQQGVTQSDNSASGIVIVLSVLTLMTALFAYLNFRFPRLRPWMEGRPVVLIDNGDVIERNLRRERLTVAEVEAEARLQQIPSLGQVRWAVLERNGKISFIEEGEDVPSVFAEDS
ncbi:MAG TPA: YetF domain-containing protein [Solirubrobacterales bacterium]|nr:YetF domain-containing protein [Solirubrobacterales bacterium]